MPLVPDDGEEHRRESGHVDDRRRDSDQLRDVHLENAGVKISGFRSVVSGLTGMLHRGGRFEAD